MHANEPELLQRVAVAGGMPAYFRRKGWLDSMRSCAVLIAVASLVATTGLRAQVPFDRDRNQGLGAFASLSSGGGVSYQEVFPNGFGFRGVVAAWIVGDSSFIDFGVSGLRILGDDGRRRVYLVGSYAYWRSSEEDAEDVFDLDGNLVRTRTFDDVDDSWALGFGVGYELPMGTTVSVSLEGVFTYWSDTGDLLPLPQIGIHYLF
jgi:hypothetical protein